MRITSLDSNKILMLEIKLENVRVNSVNFDQSVAILFSLESVL